MRAGNKFANRRQFRFLTSKKNADSYNNRIVSIGGDSWFDPSSSHEECQRKFVGNAVKSSKYTLISFLPCNLFFQFRRFANFYFLIVALVQLTIDSPVSPFTSISPLVFVILVTMIKQGYEDFMRHRNDAIINNRHVTRLKNGTLESIPAKQIVVGDVINVQDNEEFPCDLVLLSSSDPNGKANVMTANLDGETNLKVHQSPNATKSMRLPHEICKFHGQIECENPNSDLHRFVGRLRVKEPQVVESLNQENICLRGTMLKHTEYIFGCAVYTGADTKMSRNSQPTPAKFSTVELTLNRYLAFFVCLLLVEVIITSSLRFTQALDLQQDTIPWYLGQVIKINAKQIYQDCISFLVLFNYVVPISLYVTLEFQKFWGSMFLVWDNEMYDEEGNQPPKCNSSDLNEELGQVEYLFSDKTGTLTENIMLFKACSINGIRYRDHDNDLVLLDKNLSYDSEQVKHFLIVLALCHTVEVGRCSAGSLVYNASSPDEKAIVDACKNYGVTFLGEKDDVIHLMTTMKKDRYERLKILEFDSDRKCMSVIVKDADGIIRLMTKGAESVIFAKCESGPLETTTRHIDDYAVEGLRTMAVCERILSTSEYEEFILKFEKASQDLTDREDRVREVYNDIEAKMTLLGAIAVEDKLQDGVRETLIKLRMAGIKVWILTGDKKETALNISQSCGHYQPSAMTLLDICQETAVSETISRYLEKSTRNKDDSYCMVVDGKTLRTIFAFKDVYESFKQLSLICHSVICCRMSPLQKAEIVKMIKHSPMKPVTASIGDGGNDVSMIQEAHVGIGISGREGRAAVRAADFAFGKFRFLQKALLVHGHWYYYRVSMLVHYFFYKNVVGFTGQFIYAFFNDFSTQTLYDSLNLSMYNIVFTSIPVLVFGLLEQNISSRRLKNEPWLYEKISHNQLLNFKNFSIWLFEGFWHAIVIFFGFYLFWDYTVDDEPEMSRITFGMAMYQAAQVVVSLRLLLQSRFWNPALIFSIILSLALYLVFAFIYGTVIVPPNFPSFNEQNIHSEVPYPLNLEMFGEIFLLMSNPNVWLGWLLLVTMCLIPDIAISAYRKSFKNISIFCKNIRIKLLSSIGKGSFDLGKTDNNTYINMAYIQSTNSINKIPD